MRQVTLLVFINSTATSMVVQENPMMGHFYPNYEEM